MKSTIVSIITFGSAARLSPVQADTYTFKDIAFRQSRRKVSVRKLLIGVCAACTTLYAGAWRAEATSFLQTNLVSDLSGLATITDPFLQNPWGISHSSTSPFWVSNQFTSTATLYAVTGSTNVAKVDTNPATPGVPVVIPFDTTPSGPQGPTGTVFNSAGPNSGFPVGAGGPSAVFMFANLNGTISGWNPAVSTTAAFNQVTTPGAIYTGLAFSAPPMGQPLLYAANNAGAGSINVFDKTFQQAMGLPAGAFATPAAISALHLVPFNVQVLNGFVYVTYAPSGHSAQANATAGQGAVAVFNLDGSSLPNTALVVGGQHLAAPWGLAIAPAGFGQFAGDLLVGNFSGINLGISVFDLMNGTFEGTIPINPGSGNTSFLWALSVGNGVLGGDPNTLYFTDGLNSERDGLFGAISAVPEPATWAMMLIGFAGLGFAFRQSRRKLSFA
jgi:uncharacterized protein (TIGR03118 family)